MTNVEALKGIYAKLGGSPSAVKGLNTTLEVLNAIDEFYGGDGDAEENAEAIANISSNMPSYKTKSKTIVANGTYTAASENVYGFSSVMVAVANAGDVQPSDPT